MIDENTKEEIIDYKSSIIVASKTLGLCFICFAFIICAIYVISPRMSIEINRIFGFNKVEELSYQNVYKRSKKATD